MHRRLVLAMAVLGGSLAAASIAVHAQNDPVYVVKDGLVDQHTFNGYRRYGESCMRCHGPDGAEGVPMRPP